MPSSYSIEMQYGPCSSLVSRPFLHVVEVSLTLVSYTIGIYMDVCGSTYGNGDWSMAVNLVLLTISKSVCDMWLSSTDQSCTECGKSSDNNFFIKCIQ